LDPDELLVLNCVGDGIDEAAAWGLGIYRRRRRLGMIGLGEPKSPEAAARLGYGWFAHVGIAPTFG
jgi:hypothetical protein